MRCGPKLLALWALCGLLSNLVPEKALAARCFLVFSYHAGYVWNDDIEKALDDALRDHCEIDKLYMDGKRHAEKEFSEQKALEAKKRIDEWKPDVVVAADDLASKHLVAPYLKDVATPVVFCGINWTGDPYGYPYSNTTGMIEVGPIDALVLEVRKTVPSARRGVFLSADELTQKKEFDMNKAAYEKTGITLTHSAYSTMGGWEEGYADAQEKADFIMLGNNAGINDWDNQRAATYVSEHGKVFTVAYLDWMAPYSMLTMSKIAAEQGEWAGSAALLILRGKPPASIPVVANRRWNMFINPPLLEKAGVVLDTDIMQKAVKVGK